MTDDPMTKASSAIEVVDRAAGDEDEFFCSPDVGRLVRRGDFLYTQYGQVIPCDACVRMLPCAVGEHENYADWSEEQRRRVREVFEAEAQRYRAEEADRRERRDALVEKVREKLTEEEWDAIYDWARE